MASRRPRREPRTPSPELELPEPDELERLKLSAEVAWYLVSRGIPLPDCPPAVKTPEAGEVLADARFNAERVDKVLGAFGLLRHTKGKWAGQSLRPDPWQVAYVLAPAFGWEHLNEHGRWVRVVTQLYVDVPRKNGKALALTTPVPTPTGWTTQGELKIGDEVFTAAGQVTTVVATTNVMHERPCYRLTFAGGEQVVADAGHLWRTAARRQGRTGDATGLRTTDELARTMTHGGRGDRNHFVDVAGPLDLSDADLPVDPYVLGYWLGDGHSAAARITVHGDDLPNLRAQVAAAGYHLGEPAWVDRTATLAVSTTPVAKGSRDCLQRRLRDLALLDNKHIPQAYLRGSAGQRLALLQGLMDSDGTISVRGQGMSVRQCEFSTTSAELADAVAELVASLGVKVAHREGRARLDGRDVGPKYRLTFTVYRSTPVFRLPRKLERLSDPPATNMARVRSRSRAIESVEPVDSVPVKCIQVAHPEGMYLVGRGLIPTHNSTISGGVSIYLACADGEAGAEVIVAATGLRQAGYVFDPVKTLAKNSPALRPHVKPLNRKIVHRSSGSYIECVAAVADAMHGGNIHGGVVDELHLHRDAELVEAIESGTGSREQPLIVMITTADDGQTTTIYARKRDRVEKLAERVITHPSTFGVIWCADEADDPFVEDTWRKANPGAGVSPSIRYLRDAAEEAREDPAKLAGFLRLHLGIRTGLAARYIPLDAWDRNAGMVRREELEGMPCYGGLDLATTSDLTAFCLVFPDQLGLGYDVLWRHWIPERAFKALDERTSGQATVWRRSGLLSVTPGDVTDYAFVRAAINADRETFDVGSIGYDRWNASQVCVELENEDGAPMVKIGQGFASLSAPLKALKHELLAGTAEHPRLRHGGNALVRWQATNLRTEQDAAGNVKPSKKTSMDKIDGFQAAVDAMAVMLAAAEPEAAAPTVW